MNRKILRKLIEIEKEGILARAHVVEADDGLTAVEAVRSAVALGDWFDLVLMDYTMVMRLRTVPFGLDYANKKAFNSELT